MNDVPMAGRGTVVVLGSVHTDLIATASRMPGPGDSVTGTSFATAPGGKAGNQACQLAKCGLDVALVGKVGADHYGAQLRVALEAAGVGTRFLSTDPIDATGTSTVLSANGEYASIIVPGAAATLTNRDIDEAFAAVEEPAALVLQLELPIAIVTYAAQVAAGSGWLVVLNASPVPGDPTVIPESLWAATNLLVVNRAEADRLLAQWQNDSSPADVAAALAGRYGVGTVALTLGPGGAVLFREGTVISQPAFPAEVVDSVGAGDAFLGALVAGILGNLPSTRALLRAAAAGAIAVAGRGALGSLPTAAEIDAFLSRQSPSRPGG